jgi:hypothetical protein
VNSYNKCITLVEKGDRLLTLKQTRARCVKKYPDTAVTRDPYGFKHPTLKARHYIAARHKLGDSTTWIAKAIDHHQSA